MKIGRNEPCPCGSGKKYKKCCIDKKVINSNLNSIYGGDSLYDYHNNCLHTEEVKYKEINNKLLFLYDNYKSLSKKEIIDNYFIVMNFILDYAVDNNIRDVEKLDDEKLVSDFIGNIISDFECELENVDKDKYDFDVIFDYLDRIVNVLDLDDNTYEWHKRCKTHLLFKLGDYELAEKIMLDLIEEKNNSIYPYVELVDDFDMVGLMDKAKYYYDLGMTKTKFEDLDVLEERKDYFDK